MVQSDAAQHIHKMTGDQDGQEVSAKIAEQCFWEKLVIEIGLSLMLCLLIFPADLLRQQSFTVMLTTAAKQFIGLIVSGRT